MVKCRSSLAVEEALATMLSVLGGTLLMRTDNERAFVSDLLTRLRVQWGIDHILTRPYHSEANGHVERFHRFLNSMLAIKAATSPDWVASLPSILFTYNNGVHRSTGFSPYFLFHGRHADVPVTVLESVGDAETPNHRGFAARLTSDMRRAMRESYEIQTRVLRARERGLNEHRTDTVFRPDDIVMLYEPSMMAKGHNKKQLSDWFTGPHRVLRRVTSRSYISHADRHREVTADVKDLRLFHPFTKFDMGDGPVPVRGLRAGDLCIVPILTDAQPFYVARVTRMNKKSIVVQWFGNLEDRCDLKHLPAWVDSEEETYYAEERDCLSDKPYTNSRTGPRLTEKDIGLYGFQLSDGVLDPAMLRLISDCPAVPWTVEEGDQRRPRL
jgi:hypothetical protein